VGDKKESTEADASQVVLSLSIPDSVSSFGE